MARRRDPGSTYVFFTLKTIQEHVDFHFEQNGWTRFPVNCVIVIGLQDRGLQEPICSRQCVRYA
ncbi:hypothetical protein BC628DRAFT_1015990 [Trametes gibbosa]|nr:hypothetical protein BC628DRAFT_1015990 [Trametes gibbosa]